MPIRVDRKSHSHSQLRSLAALAATSLAAVTLMIGPDATLGLDVSTAGGAVTGTTQTVTSTVQQTTQQVTTTVDSTTQSAVQTTQQVTSTVEQTAAPVTSAPATSAPTTAAPVRTSTKTVSATKQAVTRATQPAAKAGGASSVTAVTRAVQSTTRAAADSGAGAKRAVRSLAAHRMRTHTAVSGAPRTASPQATTSCRLADLLGPLEPLLSALSQDALLGVACDATSFLAPVSPAGTTSQPKATLSSPVIGLVASIPAHLKVLGMLATAGTPQVVTHHAADGRIRAGSGAGPRPVGAPFGSAGSGAQFRGVPVATNLAAATTAASRANEDAAHHGNGLFGSSVTGTEAVFALLVADWALLVGIAMWKLARRRPFAPLFS